MNAGQLLAGHYDYRLVALSVCISILAAYAALDLAERVTAVRGWMRQVWLDLGAMAMGIGIWAMHYLGMVAFTLPIPVRYGWPTILLSLLVAIVASWVALFAVSQPTMGMARLIAGSIVMGFGISAMNYIGMAAMRLQAKCVYSPWIVSLSVALAVVISFVALRLAFARREIRTPWSTRKFLSALLMGLAIPVTFYVGMAAVSFIPEPSLNDGFASAVRIGPFAVATICIATVIILGHVCILSSVERRFSLQAQLLAENESQLQAIFDHQTEGIVVLDRQLNIVRMNRAADVLLGHPSHALTLEQVREGVDFLQPNGEPILPEHRPSVLAFQGVLTRNREMLMHYKHSGMNLNCEIDAVPIANQAGEIVQIIMSYRDITERKRLDESRARLAAIVESTEDAIIGKDLRGIVTNWNKGAEKIFGYSAEEMIGHSIQSLLVPGREREEEQILDRIRRGETVEHFETVRKRKDGHLINVSLSISPIRDANNVIVGASKIARDITERMQLERQLHQSQKMEAIGQLTGGIAHDFNNLLGIVLGNLDLLERMIPGDEKALKRVQTAQKAAARGAELTRRMLQFSSKEELSPTAIKLEVSIHNVIELAGRALGPEISIATHFDRSIPAVFADAAGLESALLNLIVNARDAMPKGGNLTINTNLRNLEESYPPVQTGELKPRAYACITVTDTGHGMSQETLDRALEPFFTTKQRDKGTGLGLAMVYGFAKQSGGTVRLYSELGFGTSVSLYLPFADASSQPSLKPARVIPSVKPGCTVLVVDDETDLLEIACIYLSEMGYTVLQAENGSRALEAVARTPNIDLMITDVIMPGGMNGMELAQKVRQLSPGTKVIFSSGFPADALAERSGTAIDGPLLHKPYQRDEFAAIIHGAINETVAYRGNASSSHSSRDARGQSNRQLEER